jgi:hypothetical protein
MIWCSNFTCSVDEVHVVQGLWSVHTLPCMISLMVRVTVGSSLGRGLSMESMLWWCLVSIKGMVVWRHSARFSLRTKQTHSKLVGESRVTLVILGYYLAYGITSSITLNTTAVICPAAKQKSPWQLCTSCVRNKDWSQFSCTSITHTYINPYLTLV